MLQKTVTLLITACCLILACRTGTSGDKVVKFVVGNCDGPMLSSVRVTVVSPSGAEIPIGSTGVSGSIDVPMSRIRGAAYVLFEHDGYFSAVIRGKSVEGETVYVALAPFAVL